MKKATLRTYLDEKNNILYHLFSGKELCDSLRELNKLDQIQGVKLGAYLASLLPFLGLLKQEEGLGIYISNDDRTFYFNIEIDFTGNMRLMFVPKNNFIDDKIKGKARIVKILPDNKQYSSIIPLEDTPADSIANYILDHSYQIHGHMRTHTENVEGILGLKLPFIGGEKIAGSPSLQGEQWQKFCNYNFNDFVSNELSQNTLLNNREIRFHCRCNRENFITGLMTLPIPDRQDIFSATQNVTLSCDYCHKEYIINANEVLTSIH